MAVGLGTLTLNLIAQTGLFTQGLNRAEQQTRSSARNMSNELNLVGKSFKDLQGTLMASFAGALTIGAAISKMDAYTGLQNRLKLVTASQTELNNALKDTFNIAQATGQSWDSTAQVYQRFADNAKRLGMSSTANTVILGREHYGLQVGDVVKLAPGCDQTRTGPCHTLFNNTLRFMGFPNIPNTNPTNDQIIK